MRAREGGARGGWYLSVREGRMCPCVQHAYSTCVRVGFEMSRGSEWKRENAGEREGGREKVSNREEGSDKRQRGIVCVQRKGRRQGDRKRV